MPKRKAQYPPLAEHQHNLRLPAEWEPQAAVLLTWPHQGTDWISNLDNAESVYVALTNQIRQFEYVLIVALSERHQKHIHALLSPSGKQALYPVQYCYCATNDTWTRDYGPISLFKKDQLILQDFMFNGWGGKHPAQLDTQVNQRLFQQAAFQSLPPLAHLQVDMNTHQFVLEGGGIETDGYGTLLATKRCLLSASRNPTLSKLENERYLKQIFGLKRILWIDYGALDGDDTDSHIDTLVRFLSPTHIVYQGCDDPGDSHFHELDQMARQLRALTQTDGSPYQLTPLPWPEPCFNEKGDRLPATYANFLMINDAVLIPLYNVPQDQMAMDLFQSLCSGNKMGVAEGAAKEREVIGINCRALIEQFGSLHCITMNIMKPLH